MQTETGYKSYVLRIWQVQHDDESVIAAMIEDCQTNERQAFPNLTALLEFLATDGQPAGPTPHNPQSEETNT